MFVYGAHGTSSAVNKDKGVPGCLLGLANTCTPVDTYGGERSKDGPFSVGTL
jgi:hypothetical protein